MKNFKIFFTILCVVFIVSCGGWRSDRSDLNSSGAEQNEKTSAEEVTQDDSAEIVIQASLAVETGQEDTREGSDIKVNQDDLVEDTQDIDTSAIEEQRLAKNESFEFPCNKTNYEDYIYDFQKVNQIVRQTGCTGKDCIGMGCQLQGMDFSGKDLKGTIFSYANLTRSNFENANVKGAIFRRSDLSYANLKTDIFLANFIEAILSFASFDDINYRVYDGVRGLMSGRGIRKPEKRGMIRDITPELASVEVEPTPVTEPSTSSVVREEFIESAYP